MKSTHVKQDSLRGGRTILFGHSLAINTSVGCATIYLAVTASYFRKCSHHGYSQPSATRSTEKELAQMHTTEKKREEGVGRGKGDEGMGDLGRLGDRCMCVLPLPNANIHPPLPCASALPHSA